MAAIEVAMAAASVNVGAFEDSTSAVGGKRVHVPRVEIAERETHVHEAAGRETHDAHLGANFWTCKTPTP